MLVQYRGIRQRNEAVVGATSRDISVGGLRLIANEFVSVFTRLVVEVSIPSTLKPIRGVSRVIWVRKRPYGEQYEVGLQFMDIPDEEKRSIAEFVKRSIPK